MSFPVHEHCRKMATKQNETPWWAAFPEPVSRPDNIEPSKVFELLEERSKSPDKPRDFLLVDVRRTDYEGGTVESSINLPAHSFYQTRKIVYDLCRQAGIKKVIFYCGKSHALPIHMVAPLTTSRILQRSRSQMRLLDARLHQRRRGQQYSIPHPDRRHQGLGEDVFRPEDGWV